jgi:GntR family transcriptional regulator
MLSNSNRLVSPGRFSTRPLYLQVRDALASRIAGGEWKPNAAIPNEGDLAREFGVSSGTMRKALDLMEGERLLTRRQGRGTFVNDQSSDELSVRFSNIRAADGERIAGDQDGKPHRPTPTRRNAGACTCARRQGVAHPADAAAPGRGRSWSRTGHAGVAVPGPHEQDALPHRIVVLAQQYGILLGKGTSGSPSAPSASARDAEPENGAPILVLDRLVHDLDGHAVEWRLGMGHFADKYYLAEIS